jgi:hypothetical protein
MKADDMIMVSIDDHVIEPEDMFDNHMPAKYKDEAPRYVRDATGRGYWSFQGVETGMSGLGAVASWPHEEWDLDPVDFAEMRPATYDVELRVRDMDANGQLTGMCFPTFAGFNGMSLARSTVDRDLTNAVVSAYNDWHIDELAGQHPGRFLPLAIVGTYDPAAMVAEIARVAAKGCTAVSLPETPYGVGLPSCGAPTSSVASSPTRPRCTYGTGSASRPSRGSATTPTPTRPGRARLRRCSPSLTTPGAATRR